MKTINGLDGLYARYRDGDEQEWIMVLDKSALFDANKLILSAFIISDDEDEEAILLKKHPNFMPIPTFQDIIYNEAAAGRSSLGDLAESCVFYLKMDNFRE